MSFATVPVQVHIAGEVRAAFARKRISVRQAAARLGLGQTVLHRRVTGEIPFTASELAAIADLIDVPVESFFRDRPKVTFRKEPFKALAGISATIRPLALLYLFVTFA